MFDEVVDKIMPNELWCFLVIVFFRIRLTPALPPEALLASLTGRDRQNGLVGALRTEPEAVQPIGQKEIQEAADILTRYKQGKANLESRIVEDELWRTSPPRSSWARA